MRLRTVAIFSAAAAFCVLGGLLAPDLENGQRPPSPKADLYSARDATSDAWLSIRDDGTFDLTVHSTPAPDRTDDDRVEMSFAGTWSRSSDPAGLGLNLDRWSADGVPQSLDTRLRLRLVRAESGDLVTVPTHMAAPSWRDERGRPLSSRDLIALATIHSFAEFQPHHHPEGE